MRQMRMRCWIDAQELRCTVCAGLLERCWPKLTGASLPSWFHRLPRLPVTSFPRNNLRSNLLRMSKMCPWKLTMRRNRLMTSLLTQKWRH